jgi:hypothetical protein
LPLWTSGLSLDMIHSARAMEPGRRGPFGAL